MKTYYLAIDIGASGGRHILGALEDGRIQTEMVYRFENEMRPQNGHLCWDHAQLFREIKEGMRRCRETGRTPRSVGIDTWGVDFVLLDGQDRQIGEAVAYRDHRTDGIHRVVDSRISRAELYERTGVQFQPYNTLSQLMALQRDTPEQLERAQALLMTPDYFNFLLTGCKKQEYTIASTSQLLDVHTGDWDRELIGRMGLPERVFLPVEQPGMLVGRLRHEVAREVGFDCGVIAVASHDTASAAMAVLCLKEDALYISSGTWSLMGCENGSAHNDEASMAAGFTNEGGYARSWQYLKNIMGLWMIQSVRKEFGKGQSFDEICRAAAKEKIRSVVDCGDARFLAPADMTAAVQAYCRETGQQVPETLPELACVIYRSLAKCYAETKAQLETLTGNRFGRIHIVGGGSQAEYLNRLTAAYTGCEVLAGPAEATALGSLLCQMLADGAFPDLSAARQCIADSFPLTSYR